MEGDIMSQTTATVQTAPKRVINGWAMYDWSNSVYNLVITTTFFPIYFTAATRHFFKGDTIPFLGRTFNNSSLYSYALAAAYLIIALLYPILTSIADTRGNKKTFMQFFCYLGAFGCSALFFFTGANVWLGVIGFILASMGYVGSLVFYNAYLPEIAAPEDQDRVSAKGYAYGYIGSVLLQIIGFVFVLVIKNDPFLGPRLTFLATGLWWAGFAQLTFRVLQNRKDVVTGPRKNVLTSGFSEVKKVYGEIRKMAVLKRFLRAFFFYSMGVQTVMTVATLFGSVLLKLDDTKLIVTVVLIQVVAIVGAMWMSNLSKRFGNIRVLMGVIMVWILVCISAYITAGQAERLEPFHTKIQELKQQRDDILAHKAQMSQVDFDKQESDVEGELSRWEHDLAPHQEPIEYAFYGLALGVGLIMGGVQSLSRSTYSKMMPETKDTASYFSYYDLTEKIAIVIGMFSFGAITELTHTMKNAIIFLTVFFVIGLVWLYSALLKQKKESGGGNMTTGVPA